MSHIEKAREVMELEIQGIKQVLKSLDSSFDDMVEMVLSCLKSAHKIVVTGVGKSLHIAQKLSATLRSTGTTSIVLDPIHAVHGDLGVLDDGDLLIVLSYSGESEEALAPLPTAKRQGVSIVALTGGTESRLAHLADLVVPVKIEREACPFNIAPTTSTTAMLAVGDALAMAVLSARGFTEKDYARLHPAGTIGKTLLMRVSEIMRTGDRVAIVKKGVLVKDAVLAITSARSGSAAVVDENDKLIGIVTDGDLRRHLATDSDLGTRNVEEIMTKAPVTVGPEQLAADALRVFEQKSIDDILVVDDSQRIVGAVDIQDLPKLKVI